MFVAWNGRFLEAHDGGLTSHHNIYDHPGRAVFYLEPHGENKVALKTHNGKYVCANGNGDVWLNYDPHHDEAKWRVDFLPDGRIGIQSHHNGFLGLNENQGNHHVRVHYQMGTNELWTIKPA